MHKKFLKIFLFLISFFLIVLIYLSTIGVKTTKFNDLIKITSWISKWKEKSFVISHKIHNEGKLVVKGSEVRVWAKPHPTNLSLIKTDVIPDEIRNNFDYRI